MPSDIFYRDRSPVLSAWVVVVLAAIYLLSGIVGRDPWRTEDAIHLGIAYHFLGDGQWLFPHVAGEPWPHVAPLYHWVAALLGHALDGWLPFHDAARLATPLFGAVFLFALARAARAFHGAHAARVAPLLAIGTLGLLLPMHESQPAVAGIACAALAWWGAGLLLREQVTARWSGTLLLGFGCGLAFPAYGLVGLLMAGAALPAPILLPPHARKFGSLPPTGGASAWGGPAPTFLKRDWPALAIALSVAAILAVAWPLAVIAQTPQLWDQWWRNELAEVLQARSSPGPVHLELLAWGYLPILPIALWSLWLERRQLARWLLPLCGALLGLAWFLSGSARLPALLPAMAPLIIIASAGADRLRRGAANAWNWFALMAFSFFAALVWLGASAQGLDWPPKVAANFAKTAPGHVADYSLPVLLWAGLLSLAWLWSWRLARAPWRACLHWGAGATLLWALTAALWFSWLDHARSHRQLAESLRAALPAAAGCIERTNLGAAQRALLDYHAGIRTRPRQAGLPACEWHLLIDRPDRATPSGWVVVWQGSRPGERRERWYLERRKP